MNVSEVNSSLVTTDTISTNSVDILVGTVCFFVSSSAPSDWLVCDGSAISRTTYDDLFAAIGTIYGAGDSSTTFNLPDFRGTFFRVLNKGNTTYDPNSSSSRAVGSWQDYAQQRFTGVSSSCQRDYNRTWERSYGVFYDYQYTGGTDSGSGSDYCSKNYFDSNRHCAGSDREARPNNISLCPCIKY